ncbi:MAG: ATP synthase F0 subunit B [Candidatus Vogelbacteria bacterium]|nr:ATP synthase F0 subunit B [Candidatus Vogelbacteria bacterium]
MGINGKLLLAQGINFFIVFIVLRVFVYRPLLQMMKARREKIEKGLLDAKEAEEKLLESEIVKQRKIEEGEKRASIIVEEAGNIAKKHAKSILADAVLESRSIVSKAGKIGAKKIEAELLAFENRAKEIIVEALSSAVALSPESIDEKLTEDALRMVRGKKV